VADVEIDFDVPVPMRDGTVLRADVYRPAGPGPFSVLLQRIPYCKRLSVADLPLDTLLAVSRGYIVVQQDTRGRFASDGEWTPWTYEQSDGHDTVKWAANLPGSSGAVGMFGVSYTGNTSWTAAIDGPPELRAIAPQNTWSEPNDGLFMRGGALEFGLNAWWTLTTGLGDLPKRLAGTESAAKAVNSGTYTAPIRHVPSSTVTRSMLLPISVGTRSPRPTPSLIRTPANRSERSRSSP
jgi:putative CocE/NonD family hydrolase